MWSVDGNDESDPKVLRQIVLNSDMEVILTVEPTDKRYHAFLFYVDHRDYKNRLSRVENLDPFLEIVILLDTSNLFSYKLFITSANELERRQWNKIGSCVNEQLRDFEYECFGTKGQLFYHPTDEEKENVRKRSEEIVLRLRCAYKIKQHHERLQSGIRRMIETDRPLSKIASRFKLSNEVAKEALYGSEGGRPQFAELSKIILLKSGLAKKLGIVRQEELEDRILHRKWQKAPHKLKSHIFSKRLRAFNAQSKE